MTPVPKWFKPVAIVALLWNLLGCFAFAADAMMTPEQAAKLPPAQQALYHQRPGWFMIAYGAAVIGGALGCVGLLARQRLAAPLFAFSLGGLIVQDVALFGMTKVLSVVGPAPLVIQSLVLVVAVLLLFLARKATKAGWIG